MKYNVLWIDDDYVIQADFIGQAEQEDINIIPFESHEEGIAELDHKPYFFHAVILDAKVKNRKNDTHTGLAGLSASRDRLIEINKDGYLPWFIFTGQPDYVEASWFNESFGKYYIKAKDNDSLLHDIKVAVENKKEYIIQKKYQNVFEACSSDYIGEDASAVLLLAIKLIEGDQPDTNFKDSFNSLRKLVELLFKRLNQLGILPYGVFHAEGWINQSSRFLSGKHEKYLINEGVFHPIVCHLVFSILQISQDASHEVPEKLRLRVSQFVDEMQTPNLYISTLHQLFDVLIWFKHFIDNHPDPEQNKKLWSEIVHDTPPGEAWIPGMVSRIAENGFGTFQPDNHSKTLSIMPQSIALNNLKENDKIEITTKPDSTGTKTHIDQIRKITS